MEPHDDSPLLLALPERSEDDSEPLVKPLFHPIWTANKAKLIEAYLRLFVYITHHGTYIDGFAGPQRPDLTEMWSAKLVLESQPRWFRNFHLFEKHSKRFKQLQELKDAQPLDPHRTIEVYCGDFNVRLHELLTRRSIREKEATFCLLDQRTFQCQWSTVAALADYKKAGRKIELFYFLASKWFARAIRGVKDEGIIEKWWGRDDWRNLRGMSPRKCADEMVRRFKTELGYKSAKPWPIFRTGRPGVIMYYMIHASDHADAPLLMRRAYDKAVTDDKTEQLVFPGMEPSS